MAALTNRLMLGLLISILIGGLAYWRRSLTAGGVVGAVIVGTLIFGFGGWVWGLVLIAFFVLSSLLSRFREKEKLRVAGDKFEKGSQRDLAQALANGGAGALIAVLGYLFPGPLALAAFLGAMGTVTADTWATELGVLSKKPPILITTFKPVERGTSGGISAAGGAASLLGGLVIGVTALALMQFEASLVSRAGWLGTAWVISAAAIGGLAGSLFDSFLGATVQAIYFSPGRGKETEKPTDPDGQPNTFRRGWRWMNNDMVNFISSLVGAGAAMLAWLAWQALMP